MRLYLLSGPDCVMAKSASGHSKTEGCRFSVHGAASRGPEAMHPASCAGVKKTTGPAVVRIKLLAGNGNNSGMNGMPITKEFAFIAREVHSQNGGWL